MRINRIYLPYEKRIKNNISTVDGYSVYFSYTLTTFSFIYGFIVQYYQYYED